MSLRPRATIIVEVNGEIVLTEDRHDRILLPGGGIHAGEPPLAAAVRELHEETALVAVQALYLFEHASDTNRHHVFWIAAQGKPVAGDDAVRLHYLAASALPDLPGMSPATKQIIASFRELRREFAPLFAHLADSSLEQWVWRSSGNCR